MEECNNQSQAVMNTFRISKMIEKGGSPLRPTPAQRMREQPAVLREHFRKYRAVKYKAKYDNLSSTETNEERERDGF